MIKKCLIAIAVVAMLATTVQAISVPDGSIKFDPQTDPTGWPWTRTTVYDKYEICKIDVKLEVGYFVQIDDCGDIDALKLKQVNCDVIGQSSSKFPCHSHNVFCRYVRFFSSPAGCILPDMLS